MMERERHSIMRSALHSDRSKVNSISEIPHFAPPAYPRQLADIQTKCCFLVGRGNLIFNLGNDIAFL